MVKQITNMVECLQLYKNNEWVVSPWRSINAAEKIEIYSISIIHKKMSTTLNP